MKRVSLSDIAKKVGVSTSLVSIVLNGRGEELGINKETQQKVISVAKEMNYRPNQLARSLRLNKSNTIGLILSNITDKYFSRIASSVEKFAEKLGYQVIICTTHEKQERETEQIHMLLDRGVDGLIITPTKKDHSWIKDINQNKIPFVFIDRYFSKIDTNYVVYENFQGAFDITNHLLSLGYTKIAQLTLIPYMNVIAERDRGYREALMKNNIRYNKKLVKEICLDNMYDDVKKAIQELLRQPDSVQAIFTHNTVLTEYVLEVSAEMKLRIPKDFALVSFGDQKIFNSTNPSITCVKTPTDEIGEKAMEILMNSINNKIEPTLTQITLPTEIVLRESCGRFLF